MENINKQSNYTRNDPVISITKQRDISSITGIALSASGLAIGVTGILGMIGVITLPTLALALILGGVATLIIGVALIVFGRIKQSELMKLSSLPANVKSSPPDTPHKNYSSAIKKSSKYTKTDEKKPSGSAKGWMATNKKGKKYLIKGSITSSFHDHDPLPVFNEFIASSIYTRMLNTTADTDVTYLTKKNGRLQIASRWIENFQPLPQKRLNQFSFSPEKGELFVKLEDDTPIYLNGIVSIFIAGSFIGDSDYGKNNWGYVVVENEAKCYKIDSGCAFAYYNSPQFLLDNIVSEICRPLGIDVGGSVKLRLDKIRNAYLKL